VLAVAGTVEGRRHPLDSLGRGVERSDNRVIGLPRMIGGGLAGLVQAGKLLLEASHALRHFRQLIGNQQRRHHRKPHIPDLAEAGAQAGDPLIEFMREPRQMMLLAFVASHSVLAAIDRYAYMRHGRSAPVAQAGVNARRQSLHE
jgi:hypothetical protein